jgi:hypothetical protein
VNRPKVEANCCRNSERASELHDPDRDLVLIASLERHRANGRIGLGLDQQSVIETLRS